MHARFRRITYGIAIAAAATLAPVSSAAAQQVNEARAHDFRRPVASRGAGAAESATAAPMVTIENPVVRGGVIGALVGGAVAALATFAVIESSDRDFGIDGIYYSIFVPIGMVAGAVAGAAIGASR